jgi:hypothetical protein
MYTMSDKAPCRTFLAFIVSALYDLASRYVTWQPCMALHMWETLSANTESLALTLLLARRGTLAVEGTSASTALGKRKSVCDCGDISIS